MVSEAQKRSNRKWDMKNMSSVSCRMRKDDAESFKKYCYEKGTTPAAVLKEYIFRCINKETDKM